MARTYDDPCGLARALNLVGDRWALLVVRELLLGPKRFGQLRRGLPGASQSMLTSRLTELEEAGVLRRSYFGPPTGAWAYELTGVGRDLEPALLALARWGSRTELSSTTELSVDALALAMRTTFAAAPAAGLTTRVALVLDGDPLLCEIAGGALRITRAEAPAAMLDADATVETTAATWRSLIFAGASLPAAEHDGSIEVRGDRRMVADMVTLFPRPAPHAVV
ncbi:winged helix-turn-helix transcriptional regulator [Dactylosporangium darangshiense]|uniref:Winged helix-turn-helix transcriptional regulator n=1 Tax=Dactylosporangium darangshiense TaxID=579108 RepID=A0ABP8DKC2_9ACTN